MKEFLVTINPLDVFLWTVRRNEKDTVNLYHTLSPVMQLATGGSMLNFGLWDENNDPISAQKNLCSFIGDIAELQTSKNVADIGSGLLAPAVYWKNKFPLLDIFCVNLNLDQLRNSYSTHSIELLNSTSTRLPFGKNTLDRIVALESAQHFKPFDSFVHDARLALKDSGILALAIPIVRRKSSLLNLGILKFTWSSEHYSDSHIIGTLESNGFTVLEKLFIGSNVYEPLANYYIQNRDTLKKLILKAYPEYVEFILFKSIQKMKQLSQEKTIDYLILKCD